MMQRVIFRPAAMQDFLQTCSWYDHKQAGLGDRFEAAMERTIRMIQESPERFPIVHRDVRRALVRPYPYGVFYVERDDAIHVLAIMHGRCDPARWQGRTGEP